MLKLWTGLQVMLYHFLNAKKYLKIFFKGTDTLGSFPSTFTRETTIAFLNTKPLLQRDLL